MRGFVVECGGRAMRCLGVLTVVVGISVGFAVSAGEAARVGSKVSDFTLRDFRGKEHNLNTLAEGKKAIVIAFLGTECPLAKLYAPRLEVLAKEWGAKGVAFVGVCSNQQDSPTKVNSYARVHGVSFPILMDPGNVLADRLDAQRTPEIFLLDADRVVRYWGRVDDQYGFMESGVAYQRNEPRRKDLALAIGQLLDGKPIEQATTKVNGCLIGRVRQVKTDSDVTYSNQIARILNDRCVSCHRPGQIAPFPLRNYEETVGWGPMIKEVVKEGRMPPWHADPKFSKFINDCRLTGEQKDMIVRWVDNGSPEGDKSQLPPAPVFTEGWQIPKPDQIISMDEEFEVPAEGTVEYQRFVIDPGWKEDKWIKHVECRAGNPAVVHHVIVYIRTPSGPKTSGAGRISTDWLAAYAPGLRVPILPDGMARYAPAGSQLIFEVHYTPNGTAQKDKSYAGFVFADPKTVRKEVAVKNAGNFNFTIPPHHDNYEVESSYTFRDETLLISISPHMHLRGKDFRYDLTFPDGKTQTILWVPSYDFGWQTTYTFPEPMRLPRGTKMHCIAHFDNSDANLANPDPNAEVRWGEQTWEEMMFGWFEMALANQDLSKPPTEMPSRVKDFLAGAAEAQKDSQIVFLAKEALQSRDFFARWLYYMENVVPQVDRICVTYIDEDKLHLRIAEERNGIRTTFTSPNTVLSTKGQALAEAAGRSEPTVFGDINKAGGSVMRKMFAKGIQSSMHVPILLDGKKATVNFWSTEPNAFPPAAVEVLANAARQIGATK